MHSAASPEHYTPAWLVEPVRTGLQSIRDAGAGISGQIDLDPASCRLAQTVVRAERYYSLSERGEDGLALPWFGSVFINPPGSRDGSLVKRFWERASAHAATGETVVFIHFSLEQLLSLSKLQVPGPGRYEIVVPARRVCYDAPGVGGRALTDIARERVRSMLLASGSMEGRETAARIFAALYESASMDGTLERVRGPNPTHGSFITVMGPHSVVLLHELIRGIEREQGFRPVSLN